MFSILSEDQKLRKSIEKRCKWRKWLAWYPVPIVNPDGNKKKIWLRYVGKKEKILRYLDPRIDRIGEAEYCIIEDMYIKILLFNNEVSNYDTTHQR